MSGGPPGPAGSTQLRGRTEAWGLAGSLLLLVLVAAALWLRVRGLAAGGFADDEVHKWLAAQRYLRGDFGGDDVEHPMVMKSLIALVLALGRGALAPETITRLPSAVAGGLTVWATALLGRRLFGRAAGLVGAALVAFSSTAIGYHRIGKEDALLGLFMVLCLWCLAEARAAAEDGRATASSHWELGSAAALGAAFASKYFVFYFVIPVFAYLFLRPTGAWRVPLRRWLGLVAVALAVFLALNWTPLLPGTWRYMASYIAGDHVGGDRGVSESILFMGRLYGNLGLKAERSPEWLFAAFALLKFAPLTAALGVAGLTLALWRRAPSHRVLLGWLLGFALFSLIAGSRYGRFFVSILPAWLLLAAHAGTELARWAAERLARAERRSLASCAAVVAMGLLLVVPEARAAAEHAPHQRLYLSPLAGGDARVSWFLPHCDYWDEGVREALGWVAAHAEPGAEVASEVDWTVRYYAEALGRADLRSTPLLAGRACTQGRPCYVLTQVGRVYRHNTAALERLAAQAPVHVERIRGVDAVRVYRLEPGAALFPPAASSAAVGSAAR